VGKVLGDLTFLESLINKGPLTTMLSRTSQSSLSGAAFSRQHIQAVKVVFQYANTATWPPPADHEPTAVVADIGGQPLSWMMQPWTILVTAYVRVVVDDQSFTAHQRRVGEGSAMLSAAIGCVCSSPRQRG
jgi:hypothetical protein